jgi:hypothetical protein
LASHQAFNRRRCNRGRNRPCARGARGGLGGIAGKCTADNPAGLTISAVIALISGSPLGLLTVGVQVLARVLLPSATVFLLLLRNDKQEGGASPRSPAWGFRRWAEAPNIVPRR